MLWAKLIFWCSLIALFYVYAGYPLLLSLIAVLRSRNNSCDPGYTPDVSFLIAACNEEGSIRQKLEQTLRLEYPPEKLEVLVLSDGSQDRTDEIVKKFDDPRVRLIRIPQRRGKTNAQNVGVQHARGEILIFSDATTVFHPRALMYLVSNYQDPQVGAVSGRYQYFDPEGDSPTGTGTVTFWNYENYIKAQQSKIHTITGCCGCIYSVRRSAYTELAPDVISDLVQPLWAIQKGYRVAFEQRALAYEETTQSTSEEFSMRVRVITRGMLGLLSVPGLFTSWKYAWVIFQLVSHKVLRWCVPIFLILLFFSNAMLLGETLWRLIFLAQTVFYVAALLQVVVPLHRRWKVLGIPLYFCTLNAAACLSMIALLRGKKYVVWQPVRR